MSEIKPALTAEQWTDPNGWHSVSRGVGNRHAMAASCLHEQPFGFTVHMLRALRELGHPSQTIEEMDLAYAAIDRIEALLPPEEK